MSEDVKVYIHNYGPYVGEKIIIDSGDDGGISLDLKSLPKLIKDLQEIDIKYYLERDEIKNTMLRKMWIKREQNPSKEREIEEKYEHEVMKFYED